MAAAVVVSAWRGWIGIRLPGVATPQGGKVKRRLAAGAGSEPMATTRGSAAPEPTHGHHCKQSPSDGGAVNKNTPGLVAAPSLCPSAETTATMPPWIRTLTRTLLPELEQPTAPAPFVYTGAILSSADLASALPGIIRLTRNLGFTLHPETLYGEADNGASYHVDHRDQSVALTVHCQPSRQTVSIAVSGLDSEQTLALYNVVEHSLFGGL